MYKNRNFHQAQPLQWKNGMQLFKATVMIKNCIFFQKWECCDTNEEMVLLTFFIIYALCVTAPPNYFIYIFQQLSSKAQINAIISMNYNVFNFILSQFGLNAKIRCMNIKALVFLENSIRECNNVENTLGSCFHDPCWVWWVLFHKYSLCWFI